MDIWSNFVQNSNINKYEQSEAAFGAVVLAVFMFSLTEWIKQGESKTPVWRCSWLVGYRQIWSNTVLDKLQNNNDFACRPQCVSGKTRFK